MKLERGGFFYGFLLRMKGEGRVVLLRGWGAVSGMGMTEVGFFFLCISIFPIGYTIYVDYN
jgi:hypothetical protein